MPKVFILNKGAHDFSPAKKYGDLVYCTEGSLGKWNTSQMVRELQTAMKESDAEDFILLTSLSTLCGVACAIFAMKHGRLNLLIYKDTGYVLRKVIFDN